MRILKTDKAQGILKEVEHNIRLKLPLYEDLVNLLPPVLDAIVGDMNDASEEDDEETLEDMLEFLYTPVGAN